jgi:transaldolase/transaldolase/glucose-6-phosphate isomerase
MALERLPELGISLDHMTRQLEDDGVEKFNKPFDKLLQTLASRSPRM